jgi:hypothetical protein
MVGREINPAKRLAAHALNRAREAPDEKQRKLWEELAEAWAARAGDLEKRRLTARAESDARQAAEKASRQIARQTRKS